MSDHKRAWFLIGAALGLAIAVAGGCGGAPDVITGDSGGDGNALGDQTTTNDAIAADGSGDAMGDTAPDGLAAWDGPAPDSCTPTGGAQCGTTACKAAQWCDNRAAGVCYDVPVACICDYTCACLLYNFKSPCGTATPKCQSNGAMLYVTCS